MRVPLHFFLFFFFLELCFFILLCFFFLNIQTRSVSVDIGCVFRIFWFFRYGFGCVDVLYFWYRDCQVVLVSIIFKCIQLICEWNMTEECLHSLPEEKQKALYHGCKGDELSERITRCPHCGTFMTEHTLLVRGGRNHNCPYCGEHIATGFCDCDD